MFSNFDINRVSLGGPVFDVEKLRWLNSLWLRELSPEQFVEKFAQWGFRPENVLPVIPHVQPRVEVFSDVAPLAGHFLSGMTPLTPESFEHKMLDTEATTNILQMGLWQLEAIRHWEKENIEQALFGLAKQMDVKIRDFLYPFFIAIAGTSSTISSVLDTMALLGPDMSRARVRHAVDTLGAPGKKKLKKLEKEYTSLLIAMENAQQAD